MTTDRYTKIVLTVIAALLAVIAWTLQQYRPVVAADFDAVGRIENHDEKASAAAALLRRRHMVYVHDGQLTVERIDDPVQVQIEPR